MNKQPLTTRSSKYLVIAFVEGSAVMTVELAGGMLLAPYFGTSLIAWSAVIGFSLIGLGAGYALGARLSKTDNPPAIVFYVLLMLGPLIAAMPFMATYQVNWLADFGFFNMLFLGTFLVILPPMVLLGILSPFIIRLFSDEKPGFSSGMVYAISTSGGVITAFLLGFWVIPSFGVQAAVLAVSGAVLLTGILFFFRAGELLATIIFIAISAYIGVAHLFLHTVPFGYSLLYSSEGLHGQIKVVDNEGDDGVSYRRLQLNGIAQTFVRKDQMEASVWAYVHVMTMVAASKPEGSKALLLGMGGGTLALNFMKLGLDVDVVDIDPRMEILSREFFGLASYRFTFINDDGRRFLRTTGKKYDLVAFDVLSGETQPGHLFTVESFRQLKKILAPAGIVMINYQGFMERKGSLPFRSIFRTMEAAGYRVSYWNNDPLQLSDIVFMASLGQDADFIPDSSRVPRWVMESGMVDAMEFLSGGGMGASPSGGRLLTDAKPLLGLMSTRLVKEWREVQR